MFRSSLLRPATPLSRVTLGSLMTVLLACSSAIASAADFKIDPAHSFVEFRVQHLGFSWLHGRFNTLEGRFVHDAEKPDANAVELSIDTMSLDTNHAERDKHLRSEKYMNFQEHRTARFQSSRYEGDDNGGRLHGELTLNGVTRPIVIEVRKVGEGADPWGGYRVGYEGALTLDRAEFGYKDGLMKASGQVQMMLTIEGIRQ